MQNCLLRLQESSFVHKIDCCDCEKQVLFTEEIVKIVKWIFETEKIVMIVERVFETEKIVMIVGMSFRNKKDCHDCWN